MRKNLQELFDRNSAYRTMYVAAIDHARDKVEVGELAEWLDAKRSGAYQIQTSQAILESLERHGALTRTILVDGEPYEGTMRDLQADESIAPEAVVEEYLQATQEGLDLIERFCGDGPVQELFAQKPHYVRAFVLVLDECQGDGKSTKDLQQALRAEGCLPVDARTGVEMVHASYFTGALENAGALEWKGGRWVTTEVGSQVTV